MKTAAVARRCPKPLNLSRAFASSSAMRHVDHAAGQLGGPLWPWQRRVARVGMSRAHGRWAYPIMVVVVPRQSGKTRLVWSIMVDRCLSEPGAQVWYTAQTHMDAVQRWLELGRMLRRCSTLREGETRRKSTDWDFRIRSRTGAEEIEFANGSALRIFAPAEDSLHGSATDLVVLDEARFLSQLQGDALMAAVLPTQATRDGQVWITSTAGGPDSMFLHRQVEHARGALGDPSARVGLAEWGLGDRDIAPGGLLDAVWAEHPSAGLDGGLSHDALAVAYDQMPAWQFAHEYGNRWRTEADARLLPVDAWLTCRHPEPLPEGRPVFAADVPLDRSESVIVACVDGVVELIGALPAAAVAGRLMELAAAWDPLAVVIDAAGPAGTVAAQLQSTCAQLRIASTRDLTAACAQFHDDVLAGEAKIRPSPLFDVAAASARRRPIGQAWAWHRLDGGTCLIAASLARQAAGRPAAVGVQDWIVY